MSDPSVIPSSIRRYLIAFVARRRRIALLRRAGIALSFAMLWLLVCACVDRIFPLPAPLRVVLLALCVLAVVVLLFRPLRAMLRWRFDWRAAAAQAEARDRRFRGRLETAVSQLMLSSEKRASTELLTRIVNEADELAAAPGSTRAPWSMAFRPWCAAIVIVMTAAALWSGKWLDLPTLLRRQLVPLAPISAVTTTRIDVEPGDVNVRQGQSCTVIARVHRLGGGVPVIHLSADGREVSSQPMSRISDSQFAFTLPAVDRDWTYSVSGGDARSETYSIRVLRRPGVSQFRVRYVYPEYMKRAPSITINDDGALDAPAGTQAIVDLICTEPLKSATLLISGRTIVARRTNEPNVFEAAVPMTQSGRYEIKLLSERGVEGVPARGAVMHVEPDSPPRAEWSEPCSDLRLAPIDRVQLRYRLSDEYGIASATAFVQINSIRPARFPLKIPVQARQCSGAIEMNAFDWPVMVGDVARIWIEASDAAGHAGRSEPMTILVSPATVGVDQVECVSQLEQAARLAELLSDEWSEALRNQGALGKSSGVFGRNTHVSRCQEIAGALAQMLLAISDRNPRPGLRDALLELIDEAAICRSAAHAAIAMDESEDPEPRAGETARADRVARTVRNQLRAIWPGEAARCARADLLNLEAILDRSQNTQSKDLHDALETAGRALDERIEKLGLQPDDEQVMQGLEDRIQAGEAMIQMLSPPEFRTVGQSIAPAELSQRLLLRSRAIALLPGPDFAHARDLNLAGYALKAKPAQAMRVLADALTLVGRSEHGERVRKALAAQAGQNPELAAFEAAAQVRPIAVDPQHFDEEIRQIQSKSDPAEVRSPDPETIFDRLAVARRLQLLLPDQLLDAAIDAAIDRDPLTAATEFVKQRDPFDAVRAARVAAGHAAEFEARAHIRAVLDCAAMPDVALVAPASASEPPAQQAAPDDSGLAGYDEALRVYFKLLRKAP